MKLYKSDEIKKADNSYTKNDFTSLVNLIMRAGETVCNFLPENASDVLVVSGAGNNGADGLAAAYYLSKIGYDPTVWILTRSEKNNDVISYFTERLQRCGVVVNKLSPESDNGLILRILDDIKKSDVVIDGIFGTGFKGELLPIYDTVINFINDFKKFTVSIDIASGVNGDTGAVFGSAVNADVTVSFCNYKIGNIVMPGKKHCGKTVICDIGMDSYLFESAAEKRYSENLFFNCYSDCKIDKSIIKKHIDSRDTFGHKGDFGKVLVIAGSEGMTGAAQLCAKSALKSGCGLVYLATPKKLLNIYEITLPEIVKIPLGQEDSSYFTEEYCDELLRFSKNMDTVVIGPGLGRKDETVSFVRNFISQCDNCNLVIDADALYAYINDIETLKNNLIDKDFVITPHDGEFSNLTGEASPYKDRLTLIRQLAYYLSGNVLLKGNSTIIANNKSGFSINLTGNCGMATAGSGDVLSGIIAGLSASAKLSMYEAAFCGAYIHGLSGDIAAEKLTEIGLNASDIIDFLPKAYKKVIENE
ncbi:MAG: NAD(P)H-hydrate dehydratase [Clostridia bacterium]|nr:NAD(P)H-hydrate dehydratase [Clostridia bacterium]